ncbi:TetR/AcrR family transcriptional regulator [Streptomyces sp. NPDC059578]|uniref:TetR/AcrR family transcriptional regulator n=1 Tax=unclassified Streptomyces TaxID=2593676 RepID=UPI003661088B
MHTQDQQWTNAPTMTASTPGGTSGAPAGGLVRGASDGGRTAPLRVDAQRNLEHVLRAAREVFGELGYGAPMEDVARRARVGVGTVYRRFPSKDVLVRRIAAEETSRLTDQARAALGQEEEPWSALSRFLRTSVASGAGRLLPPHVLRVGAGEEGTAGTEGTAGAPVEGAGAAREEWDEARVPQQRSAGGGESVLGTAGSSGVPGTVGVTGTAGVAGVAEASGGAAEPLGGDTGVGALLDVVGRLVERARSAGELRGDVTVSDVLLVIATAAPSLPDPDQQSAASARLLDILLEGLRSRPS